MRSILLLSIVGLFSLASCSDFLFFGDSDSSSKIEDMNLEEAALAINNEVGSAKAEEVEYCRILPIGAKPCGGPWGYLVYSKEASNESRLKRLIERYDKLDEIRNIEEGLVSTCDVAQPPDLTVKNGSCKGEGAYAWNPGEILERNGIEDEN
jgi:hypothetical protein